MTRQELMQQIAALDKKINDKAAANPAPSLNLRHRRMPWASWFSAIFFFAFFAFGGPYLPEPFSTYFESWGSWVLIGLAVLFALSAVYLTIRFVFAKLQSKPGAGYAQATEEIRRLQDQRDELRRQLNEINSK